MQIDKRQNRLYNEIQWAAIHEEELYQAWNLAVKGIPFGKIEPLR